MKELDAAPATRKGQKGEDETELSGADYLYDEKHKVVSPAQSAIEKVERALQIENLYDPRNVQLVNHLIQALKAQSLYQRDVDYVIQEGEVKIVDEFVLAGSWRAAAGATASTRRSRRRRASGSRRRTRRSPRSRCRTTSASTRSSPG